MGCCRAWLWRGWPVDKINRRDSRQKEKTMNQNFNSEHLLDEHGNPAGGVTSAMGLIVTWQNGPLGRGADRQEPNGAFVETVIAAAKDRIEFYQADERFNCAENAAAIAALGQALDHLEARTKRREAAGVEGTHEGD